MCCHLFRNVPKFWHKIIDSMITKGCYDHPNETQSVPENEHWTPFNDNNNGAFRVWKWTTNTPYPFIPSLHHNILLKRSHSHWHGVFSVQCFTLDFLRHWLQLTSLIPFLLSIFILSQPIRFAVPYCCCCTFFESWFCRFFLSSPRFSWVSLLLLLFFLLRSNNNILLASLSFSFFHFLLFFVELIWLSFCVFLCIMPAFEMRMDICSKMFGAIN